jgi:hypothetical protein
MATKQAFTTALQELRIHFCQSDAASAGARCELPLSDS